jgi:hypothetical protein
VWLGTFQQPLSSGFDLEGEAAGTPSTVLQSPEHATVASAFAFAFSAPHTQRGEKLFETTWKIYGDRWWKEMGDRKRMAETGRQRERERENMFVL